MNKPKTKTESYDVGLSVRKKVMGLPHVEQTLESSSPFSRPIQDLITEYAWGKVWSRPGLDLKSRSILTLGMLTALNRSTELAGHVRGALNNGLTEEEILEVLLQTMVYCGAPAAQESFRIAEKVISEFKMGSKGQQG
ncbi:carboxymuconolactone decarboxylase family protein [Paenarthrobacter nitroguajacolicus]|uniref:carboxymuconolactone decarboxylase family protein n=1 Tax=Paenarthrobacter nitroguajacolicus TaxID=211146 RepID=UPI003D19C94B